MVYNEKPGKSNTYISTISTIKVDINRLIGSCFDAWLRLSRSRYALDMALEACRMARYIASGEQ
jgi:hypothetical protein